MAGGALLLAAGFALIPRLITKCSTSIDEDGPDFSASVIANASPLVGTPDDASPQKTLTLSTLRGHPIVLDFWATWCGPCQVEAPIVNGISERFKDRGLVVIGVNTSDAAGQSLAPAFAKRKGLTFPIVFDDDDVIAHKYGVESLPTLVVLNKQGKIAAVRRGVTSATELERLVRSVL